MKLATIAAVLALATPAFACPDMDHSEAPRTADKAKDAKDAKDPKDANGQAKAKADQKPADKAGDKTAKPAKDDKPTQKPADKVSSK